MSNLDCSKLRVKHMNDNPICFFDSGIGGATILKEVIKKLPNENYVYLADSNNNPYGNKTKKELFDITKNIVDKLLTYDPKMIVCACNTATAMVLDDIRKTYPNIIFVGTEPAVKVLYDNYNDKKAIILTTKGTAESEKFKKLFEKYKTQNCTLIKAPKLAGLIENSKDTYSYLMELLKGYSGTEVVVLGCTHFPLVKENISKVLGKVTYIDGGIGIANRVCDLLNKGNSFNKNKTGHLLVIAPSKKIENMVRKIVKCNF